MVCFVPSMISIYHLLLETPGANLSQIMRHINGAYTTYFNVKRARGGHLFQERFKAILVEKDEYAKEFSRYIHLNPVRAKMVETPGDYPWSSHSFYIGKKASPEWLHRDFILGYFGEKPSVSETEKKGPKNRTKPEEFKIQDPFDPFVFLSATPRVKHSLFNCFQRLIQYVQRKICFPGSKIQRWHETNRIESTRKNQ